MNAAADNFAQRQRQRETHPVHNQGTDLQWFHAESGSGLSRRIYTESEDRLTGGFTQNHRTALSRRFTQNQGTGATGGFTQIRGQAQQADLHRIRDRRSGDLHIIRSGSAGASRRIKEREQREFRAQSGILYLSERQIKSAYFLAITIPWDIVTLIIGLMLLWEVR